MDPQLEHFSHIEDVVAFVKKHLPIHADANAWKQVCEDVLHCELTKVEPLLMQELETVRGDLSRENTVRALLRATSWYTHPQWSREELERKTHGLASFTNHPDDLARIERIREAIHREQTGFDASQAAQDIEIVLKDPRLASAHQTLLGLRDQIYYQLLYPHWFSIVKQWHQTQSIDNTRDKETTTS